MMPPGQLLPENGNFRDFFLGLPRVFAFFFPVVNGVGFLRFFLGKSGPEKSVLKGD